MSTYTVTTSAELMENYIQADILLPQDTFIALQTVAGASLLFSIGTGGIFNLTMETPGVTQGWRLADLGGARIRADFPHGATCKTFGAAQAVGRPAGQAATIHLAMVVDDGTSDHLYLSLANSDADLGWTAAPAWTPCPFNAVDGTGAPIVPPSPFQIAAVFVSEAADGEYLVVDVIRNPSEPVGVLSRFYIDVATPAAPTWVPHDLAGDIQAAGSMSCLGRTAEAFGVDGIYTAGTIGPAAQLIYTPLYNVFAPGMPPLPSRLYLPGGLAADAIAAARNPDNTSDLYVAASGGLYYFASSNQRDGAIGELVVTSAFLSGVRALFACAAGGDVTVWGLDGSDEVFYLTCPLTQLTTPGAWSVPLAIMTGVDAISPYVDRMYSANTFFAHGGNGLVKAVKTPSTGLWTRHNITLPPSDPTQAATAISSYTTHIQVTDANGRAAAGVSVSLTATSVTSVYINHLYYIIGPTAIEVSTDQLGTITIVEIAHTLTGTRFTAVVDQQPALPINPMDSAFQRNAAYTSVSSLQGAVITDRNGTTRPFVPAGTSPADLAQIVQSNQHLGNAYASVASSAAPPASRRRVTMLCPAPSPAMAAAGFGGAIETDLGDLFSWLESGVEAVITIVEDAATGIWHFVATIAGEIYSGILDCVEAVVAALTWVYHAIKVLVEDIIKFLEFLFGWQDILTTHLVMKNVLLQLTQYAVNGIGTSRTQLAAIFTQLLSAIDGWADISGFDQTPGGTAAANPPPASQNSAPSNLGVHHFQGNCGASSTSYAPPVPSEGIFQELITLFENEKTMVSDAIQAIKTQIIDQFSTLSVNEIIKRFVAIVADTVLLSAETVLSALLDVLAQLVSGMMDGLTAPIDIPVLSWLYHELTGDDLSFLDLICLIAAIPVTLIYKIAHGAAPFPSGDPFTSGLTGATSFAEIQALFLASPPPVQARALAAAGAASTLTASAGDSPLDQAKLKRFGIAFGVLSLVGAIALVITTGLQYGDKDRQKSAVWAGVACVANIAYVSPNFPTAANVDNWLHPNAGNWYLVLNNVLTLTSIVKGVAAIKTAGLDDARVNTMFAWTETVMNVAWNAPVFENIIVNGSAADTTYKSLVAESVGNFSFNVGGILQMLVNEDPAMVFDQDVFMLLYGSMMVLAGTIYDTAPDQSH